MDDNNLSAATLLDRIDPDQDGPQIVRTISSMLKASDYPQLCSSFRAGPSEQATKFVNALDKACIPLSPCLTGLTPHTFRR